MEKNEIQSKSVETYAEDMAKILESNKEEGLIKKIIHQQEEEEDKNKNLGQKSQKKNRLFMFLSLLLVFLAIMVIVFLFLFKKNISTVNIQTISTSIIFTDTSVYKDVFLLTKEKIAQMVLNEVNTTLVKTGGVEGIYLTEDKKVIGFKEFMRLINGNLKVDNVGFINDNFLFGVVNQGTSGAKNLFILLKVRSFSDIFLNMRAWENKMFSDLHGFFGIDITPDTDYLSTKDFEDGIVENKNARILKNKTGDIVLMYVFADDQSLIIANTEETIHEVMLRLKTSQIKK